METPEELHELIRRFEENNVELIKLLRVHSREKVLAQRLYQQREQISVVEIKKKRRLRRHKTSHFGLA